MSSAAKCTGPKTVRESLARSRSLGEEFETAWTNATADLSTGTWGDLDAITATKPAWRAAYTGVPHGCDASFSALAETRA